MKTEIKQDATLNKAIRYIFLKELSVAEGSAMLWNSAFHNNPKIGPDEVTASNLMQSFVRRAKALPVMCACCGAKVDSYGIFLNRCNIATNMMESDTSSNFCIAPMSQGRIFNIDHIIPRSMGGTNNESNLRFTCEKCNSEKGHRMDDQDFEQVTNWEQAFDVARFTSVYSGLLKKLKSIKYQMSIVPKDKWKDAGVQYKMAAQLELDIQSIRGMVKKMYYAGIRISEHMKPVPNPVQNMKKKSKKTQKA